MIDDTKIVIRLLPSSDPKLIIEYITRLIGTMDSKYPIRRDIGYQWGLDVGNNWWADYCSYSNEITIVYRYGHCDEHIEILKAMKKVILHMKGLTVAQSLDIYKGKIKCHHCDHYNKYNDLHHVMYENENAEQCPDCNSFLCWTNELEDSFKGNLL